jgi:hypothetical protein
VVIATNETFFASKLSTSLAKSGQPVDLVHHDHIDHLGMQVLEQPLKRRAVQIAGSSYRVGSTRQPSDASL